MKKEMSFRLLVFCVSAFLTHSTVAFAIWETLFTQNFTDNDYLENYGSATYHATWGDYIGAPSAHPDSTIRHSYPGSAFSVWDQNTGNQTLDNGALRITYIKNRHYGFPMSYYFQGAKYLDNSPPDSVYINAYRAHGPERDELYLSYRVKFASNFNNSGWQASGKLPGLAGTRVAGGAADSTRMPDGTNGWSARLGWEQAFGQACRDTLVIYGYMYHKNQPFAWGHNFPFIDQDAPRIFRNQWYNIKIYVKMNTSNQANGEFKLWIDNVLRTYVKGDTMYVYNSGGTLIRTQSLGIYALQYSDDTNIKINRIWADMYFGGQMTSPDTSYIWLDDILLQAYLPPKIIVPSDGWYHSVDQVSLEPNFPNPFNPETAIRFSVPGHGRVELNVYDLAGQRVRTLVDSDLGAGSHEYMWDGRGRDGVPVASGLYFYRLRVGEAIETRKMMLLK